MLLSKRLLMRSLLPESSLRMIAVPADLSSVCSIAAGEQPASRGGLDDRAVQAIWTAVERLYQSGMSPAIGFCLRRQGQVLLNRSLGHAQGNAPTDTASTPKRLATPETPIITCSASKAVTAALVHLLAEDGRISLDRPVAYYLKAFGANGKQQITVADLLAHRGGVPYMNIPTAERHTELLADWDRCLSLVCASAPINARRPSYHAFSSGYVLGEIIQRISGYSLNEYLNLRLREPLGLRHFTYGLPVAERTEVAHNAVTGRPTPWPLSRKLERLLVQPFDDVVDSLNSDGAMTGIMPSGNLYATANDISRFYQLLLDEGMADGQRVMAAQTVQRFIRPVGRIALDRTISVPLRYSEGLMLGSSPYSLYGPWTSRAFGHLGFSNILGWADPDRDISCGLLLTGKVTLGPHLRPFFALLNTIARECRSPR